MKHRHNLTEEEIMHEAWVPIQGYEGIYEVSDMGRVRRLPGYKAITARVLNGSIHRGYVMVTLSINDIHDRRMVHRIVGQHLIANPENKPFINHLDADPANNRKTNLEWSTQSENIIHAHNIGNMGGVKSGLSKFTETDILTMRLMYGYGFPVRDLAKIYKRRPFVIRNMIQGVTYKNVPHPITVIRENI